MRLPLVVGVDGSGASLDALDWAVDAAARHQVPLRVVHACVWERYEAVSPSAGPERPAEQVLAEHVLGSAVERAGLREPKVPATGEVLPQDPVSALLDESRNAMALVVGSRGRGGLAGMLLGSVSLALSARADCPVIVVRGGQDHRREHFRTVVLGVDHSDESSAAAEFAFREAGLRGSGITAVRAWHCPARDEMHTAGYAADADDAHERRARDELDAALADPAKAHPDVPVHRQTPEANARDALLGAAATADLLVVGARRRRGRFGLQLGRTNHAVLHHAPCPVAVIPQK